MIEMFLIKSGGVAGAVAALLFVCGLLPERFKARSAALVLALGFCAIYYNYLGVPEWPPAGGLVALPWCALILALYVLLYPVNFGTRYAVRALFVVILVGACLWSIFDKVQGSSMGLRNAAAFFCLALGLWSIVEKAAEKLNVLSLIAVPMISVMAASFLFLLEGSASLSQLATSWAVVLGVMLLIGLFKPKVLSKTALVPFLSVFPVLMLIVGHFFVDINPWRLIMMCWPFLMLWFRGVIPFIPRTPIGEAVGLSALSIGPVAYWLMNIYKATGGLS